MKRTLKRFLIIAKKAMQTTFNPSKRWNLAPTVCIKPIVGDQWERLTLPGLGNL